MEILFDNEVFYGTGHANRTLEATFLSKAFEERGRNNRKQLNNVKINLLRFSSSSATSVVSSEDMKINKSKRNGFLSFFIFS